jgi:hypothetical protein
MLLWRMLSSGAKESQLAAGDIHLV